MIDHETVSSRVGSSVEALEQQLRVIVGALGRFSAETTLAVELGEVQPQDAIRLQTMLGRIHDTTQQVGSLFEPAEATQDYPDSSLADTLAPYHVTGVNGFAKYVHTLPPPIDLERVALQPESFVEPEQQLEVEAEQQSSDLSPSEPETVTEAPRIDGRAILRIDPETLTSFLADRKALYSYQSTTRIKITDDKTFYIDENEQKFRVPVDGSPSCVMQTLNLALELATTRNSGFSQSEIVDRLAKHNHSSETVWQAVNRFRKIGLFVRVGGDDKAIMFDLPEFLDITDLRKPLVKEETADFLVQTPTRS